MFTNSYFPPRYFVQSYWNAGGDRGPVRLNGENIDDILLAGSTVITDNLNSRNTCTFTIETFDKTRFPIVGQEIIFDISPCAGVPAERAFGGTIDRIVKTSAAKGLPIFHICECVDFNQIADKRIVIKVYAKQAVSSVIQAIVDDWLKEDNITTNNVNTRGLVLPRASYAYKKASTVFNEISEITGLHWYIDYFKDLHFFLRSTVDSQFVINEKANPPLDVFCDWLRDKNAKDCPGIKYGNITVNNNRETLTNKQYILGGEDLTDELENSFDGDGKTRTFSLDFKLGDIKRNADGTVANDAIVLSTGGNQIPVAERDTGVEAKWYFQKGERTITQDSDETVIATGNTITVKYQGLRPIVEFAINPDSISERSTIEENSGLYESILDDETIESQEYALERAEGLVRRFGPLPTIVTFDTDQAILRAGELINIELPEFDVSQSDFLIDSISIIDIDSIIWRSSVTCVSLEHLGGWQEFYRKLEKFGRQVSKKRRDDVLVTLEKFIEDIDVSQTFDLTELIGAHVQKCEFCFPIGFAIIGRSPHCESEFFKLGL